MDSAIPPPTRQPSAQVCGPSPRVRVRAGAGKQGMIGKILGTQGSGNFPAFAGVSAHWMPTYQWCSIATRAGEAFSGGGSARLCSKGVRLTQIGPGQTSLPNDITSEGANCPVQPPVAGRQPQPAGFTTAKASSSLQNTLRNPTAALELHPTSADAGAWRVTPLGGRKFAASGASLGAICTPFGGYFTHFSRKQAIGCTGSGYLMDLMGAGTFFRHTEQAMAAAAAPTR